MASDNGDELMELVTLRLEERDISRIDEIIDGNEDYDSRSDFIRQAIDRYNYTEPDYEFLLDAAYDAREQLENSATQYSDEVLYSLGEHIGKLEILDQLDSV